MRPRTDSVFALSGWLLADLLLASTLVFLVAMPAVPESAFAALTPSPTPEASATATPNPTATPLPTATPTPVCVRAASLEKNEFRLNNSVTGATRGISSETEIRAVLGGITNQRAGLVLTYVHAPNDGEGQRLGNDLNQRIRATLPEVFGSDAIYETFDYKDRSTTAYGMAELQVYFVSTAC